MHYVKDAGVWKPVSNAYVKDAGVWKPNNVGYVKDAGVWKQFGYGRFSDVDTVAAATHSTGGTTTTSLSGTTSTPADPNRYAILFAYIALGSGPTATINGSSVTFTALGGNLYYAVAAVPTGTTVSATVTATGTSSQQAAMGLFTVIATNGVAPVVGGATGSGGGSSSSFSATLTRPANGFSIAVALSVTSTPATSVSGSATDMVAYGAGYYGAAFRTGIDPDNSADSQTLTVNWSGTAVGNLYAVTVA